MGATDYSWMKELERRITISEGCSATRYFDSRGIPTIGIGFNLQRADTYGALLKAGVAPTMVEAVINGTASLTQPQIEALLTYSLWPIISDARTSLASGIYDVLTPARRFVICDLVYNLGLAGWMGFPNTRLAISAAQRAKAAEATDAHALFVAAANDLRQSDWYGQVGDRAKRDCAMLEVGVWCDPQGDGSDIL